MPEENGNNELGSVVVSIISNPVVDYIAGMLLIQYLISHGSEPNKPFLPPVLGASMEVGLTSALIANALGGMGGLLKLAH